MLFFLEIFNVVVVGECFRGDEIELSFATSEFSDDKLAVVGVAEGKSCVYAVTCEEGYYEGRTGVVVEHTSAKGYVHCDREEILG